MSDSDWLDISEETPDEIAPELPLSTAVILAATDAIEKREKFVQAWKSLTAQQRIYLNMWRECNFNMHKTVRALSGTKYAVSKRTVLHNWESKKNYAYIRALLREATVEEVLSKAHLVHRQNDIVETLLEPKPILYQGQHTGFEEVDGSAAARANETLLKVGGHMNEKGVEVNLGVAFNPVQVDVAEPSTVIDSTAEVVEAPSPGWPE